MPDFTVNDKYEQSFAITGEVYNGFIQVFKDNNPLHTDETFAQTKGFKGRVMHGNILNSFISYFVGECLPTKNVIIHSQEIQFKLPVYLDDKLFFEAIVTGIYESVNAVEFKFNFKNDEQKVVAKGKIQIGLLS
ncbi:MAG: MaoC/PaaZ C-terminal domain-containing protein [Bacteroidota bacterium]